MTLQDKLYKSSEVCDILGVSLRTLYRYIEENKLGSIQLASGRHRFTKDQIEQFLQLRPQESTLNTDKEVSKEPVKEKEKEEEVVAVEVETATLEVIQEEPSYSVMGLGDEEETKPEPLQNSSILAEEDVFTPMYFRCPFDDLRVIAKLIKRAGENASADYAFTGSAGLSLFYPIKAFDRLHVYVSPDQLDFWKLRLQLEDATVEASNVVLIKADSVDVFQLAGERGGLKHVSVERLKDDLKQLDMAEELTEFVSKGY